MNFKTFAKGSARATSSYILLAFMCMFFLVYEMYRLLEANGAGLEYFSKAPIVTVAILLIPIFFVLAAGAFHFVQQKNLKRALMRDKVVTAIMENSPKLFGALQRLEHDGYPVRETLEEVGRLKEYEDWLHEQQQRAQIVLRNLEVLPVGVPLNMQVYQHLVGAEQLATLPVLCETARGAYVPPLKAQHRDGEAHK